MGGGAISVDMSPILFARANAVIEYLVRLLTSESGTNSPYQAKRRNVRLSGVELPFVRKIRLAPNFA
jgi:hypothetical protein